MARKWSPDQRLALVQRLVEHVDSKIESFFSAQGYSAEYRLPGRGSSKLARVNAALAAADRRGVADELLDSLAVYEWRLSGADSEDSNEEDPMSDGKVFISHAFSDRSVGDLMKRTLALGGVAVDRIFYSSARDTGVGAGRPIEETLRENVRGAALVIELISTAFLTRPLCLMELGAAWALGKPTFPIVVPPLKRSEATGQIGNILLHTLDSDEHIEELLNDLHSRLSSDVGIRSNISTWRDAEKFFAENLAKALSVGPATATDTGKRTATAPRAVKRTRSSGSRSASNDTESPRPVEKSAARKLPGKKVSRPARRPPETDDADDGAEFEAATDALRAGLRALRPVSREAVLAQVTRGRPIESDWDDIRSAYEAREIEQDEETGLVGPNDSHPKVRRALSAARAWRDTAEGAGEELRESFETDHDLNLDPSNRDVWVALELL